MGLSESEIRSLISLLDEENPQVAAAVRSRVLDLGEEAIPYLEEAHDRWGPRMRHTLDGLLSEIRFQDLAARFKRMAAAAQPDLETGAFLVARLGRPTLEESRYRRWCDAAAATVGTEGPIESVLHRLNERLFVDLRFRGNTANFYDPANSFIDQVIDTRLGIPISLSVLYLLVARRLGLPLEGAGLPGHFMVRCEVSGTPLFIDVFHQGRFLTPAECRQFLLRSGYEFREEFLQPTPSREILARMLRNLISIYQKSGRGAKAEQASSLVEILLTGGAASGA